MSLLSKALGNAVEFPIMEAEQNLAKILIPNENVVKAYKLVRDQIIFTNERLILILETISLDPLDLGKLPNITHFIIYITMSKIIGSCSP